MTNVSWALEILKLGLSGLAFMLAYLGFRLLSQELRRKTPNEKTLHTVRVYTWQTLLMAVLVAVMSIVTLILKPPGASECRDSLSELDTISNQTKLTLSDLRSAVTLHLGKCDKVLEILDEP